MLALVLALAAAPAWSAPLDLPKDPYTAELELVSDDARGKEYLLRFPSPAKSLFAPNNVVWGHFLLPPGPGPFPAALVLPVMAAPNVWIEERFIGRFRRDGLAVLWLEMPYQFHRRPHPSMPSGQGFLARRAPRLAANFRQSALDARRALDWLKKRPEIDAGRVGLFGISLGALVGSIVYSVEPSVRFAVFLLGGADFPTLAVESSMTGPFIRKMGITPEELRKAWVGIDPLDYADANAGKPLLLVNARWDAVIPRANAVQLKKAFPAARQIWVPGGHYSAILHLLWMPRYVSAALKKGLLD